MNEQFWWYLARSTGLVAWALATAAVLWGIFLSTRALGPRPRAPWLLDLHRHLGGLTVVFTLVHMGALVADSFVHFGVADLVVPMASSWKTGAVAWGIVAFWLLLLVEVSSLLMKRLPKRVWRGIHLTSYLVFLLATVHGITAGTDVSHPATQWFAIATLVFTTFFLVYRIIAPKRAARTIPSRPTRPTASSTSSASSTSTGSTTSASASAPAPTSTDTDADAPTPTVSTRRALSGSNG